MKLLLLAPLAALPLFFSSGKNPELDKLGDPPPATLAATPWTQPFQGLRLVAEATLPQAPDAWQLGFQLSGADKDPLEAMKNLEESQAKLLACLTEAKLTPVLGDIQPNSASYASKSGSFLSSSYKDSSGLSFHRSVTCQIAGPEALASLAAALEKAELPQPQIAPFWNQESRLRDAALTQALAEARRQVQNLTAPIASTATPPPAPEVLSFQVLALGPVELPSGPRLQARVEAVFKLRSP